MGWPPRASIECTDLMLVFMGPVSLIVCHQQMLGFAPTALMVGSGEKLCTDPRIGQPTCCGLCQEPFFSGAVALLNSVDDYAKDCYMWTTWDTYGRVWRVGWIFPLQGVYRFESTRISDMNNRLSRGSLHVENLMAWMMAYNRIDMCNYLIEILAWLV
jgi:hypothetical protein